MDASYSNQRIVSFLTHLTTLPLVTREPWTLLEALWCLYQQLKESSRLERLASLAGWARQNTDTIHEEARTLLLVFQAAAMWHSGAYHRRDVRAKLSQATVEIATLPRSEWRQVLCGLSDELDEEVGIEAKPLSHQIRAAAARLHDQLRHPTI